MNRGGAETLRMNNITEKVIGACIDIHRALGPGLLESAYEECLCHELTLARLSFERQQPLPVVYKGVELECGYRLDVVVEKKNCSGVKGCRSAFTGTRSTALDIFEALRDDTRLVDKL